MRQAYTYIIMHIYTISFLCIIKYYSFHHTPGGKPSKATVPSSFYRRITQGVENWYFMQKKALITNYVSVIRLL